MRLPEAPEIQQAAQLGDIEVRIGNQEGAVGAELIPDRGRPGLRDGNENYLFVEIDRFVWAGEFTRRPSSPPDPWPN